MSWWKKGKKQIAYEDNMDIIIGWLNQQPKGTYDGEMSEEIKYLATCYYHYLELYGEILKNFRRYAKEKNTISIQKQEYLRRRANVYYIDSMSVRKMVDYVFFNNEPDPAHKRAKEYSWLRQHSNDSHFAPLYVRVSNNQP